MSKAKILTKIKEEVWHCYNECYNANIGKCFACQKNEISQTNFACGHVISEYDNGSLTLENLRPLCTSCNSSCNTKHLFEWMKENGLYRSICLEEDCVEEALAGYFCLDHISKGKRDGKYLHDMKNFEKMQVEQEKKKRVVDAVMKKYGITKERNISKTLPEKKETVDVSQKESEKKVEITLPEKRLPRLSPLVKNERKVVNIISNDEEDKKKIEINKQQFLPLTARTNSITERDFLYPDELYQKEGFAILISSTSKMFCLTMSSLDEYLIKENRDNVYIYKDGRKICKYIRKTAKDNEFLIIPNEKISLYRKIASCKRNKQIDLSILEESKKEGFPMEDNISKHITYDSISNYMFRDNEKFYFFSVNDNIITIIHTIYSEQQPEDGKKYYILLPCVNKYFDNQKKRDIYTKIMNKCNIKYEIINHKKGCTYIPDLTKNKVIFYENRHEALFLVNM